MSETAHTSKPGPGAGRSHDEAGGKDPFMEASRAPLLEHLAELRTRLIIALLGVAGGFGVCFYFSQQIFIVLLGPANKGAQWAGRDKALDFVYTAPLEQFFVYIKIGLYGGIALAFPLIAWQLYRFIAPGLYRHERYAVAPYIVAAPFLFSLGAAMVFYLIMPMIMRLSLMQEIPEGLTESTTSLLPKVSEYMALTLTLILAFGLSFQLPIVLSLAARAGLVTAEGLRKGRKYAIVVIFLIAAFVTPPDFISQPLLAIPVYLLYEVGIWLAAMAEKTRAKREAEAAAAL